MKIRLSLKPVENPEITQINLSAKGSPAFTPLERWILEELGQGAPIGRGCDIGGAYVKWEMVYTCDHRPPQGLPAHSVTRRVFIQELIARIRSFGAEVEIA